MTSMGALFLGSSRLGFTSKSNTQTRTSLAACGLRRSVCSTIGSRRSSSLRVQAIAAPEKKAVKEPFTAWGTAIERIPKRTDLKTIMILGAGPIVIGQVKQGAEFDAVSIAFFEKLGPPSIRSSSPCSCRIFLPNSRLISGSH